MLSTEVRTYSKYISQEKQPTVLTTCLGRPLLALFAADITNPILKLYTMGYFYMATIYN